MVRVAASESDRSSKRSIPSSSSRNGGSDDGVRVRHRLVKAPSQEMALVRAEGRAWQMTPELRLVQGGHASRHVLTFAHRENAEWIRTHNNLAAPMYAER